MATKLPNLKSTPLCQKLTRGMGHNLYGEPAQSNDILYIFPLVILGSLSASLGLAIGEPMNIGAQASPFATPLEILPEWYFYPTFNLLRTLPDKLIGTLPPTHTPVILLATPITENTSRYQNPFRRPIAVSSLLLSLRYSMQMGVGSLLSIDYSIPYL